MHRCRASIGIFACLVAAAVAPLVACRTTIQASGKAPVAAIGADGRPTAAAFFREPVLSHTTLSPDGNHLAAISSLDGREMLVVRPTLGGEIRGLAKLERSRLRSSWSIRRVGWAGNDHILVSVEMPSKTAIGVNARQTRLMVVRVEDGKTEYLGKKWLYQEYSQSQDNVISWLPDDPDHILLSLWIPGQHGAGARRVNIHNGALTVEAAPRTGTLGWAADHRGQVRVGFGQPDTGNDVFTLARISSDERFDEIIRWNPFEEDGFWFTSFSERPEKIYVRRTGPSGTDAIYEYDLKRRKLGARVFSHPKYDVSGLRSSKRDGRLLAIEYAAERPTTHFVDPDAKRIQRSIDVALPGRINRFTSSDRNDRVFVVESSGDATPPQYFLYDSEENTLDSLYAAYPELDGAELSTMKPIRYRARDGLEIPGYLTLPAGPRDSPLPAIVYPHGGPWARDVWGWDPVVQFLASRGFAVLQPNFRGSDGYGNEYLTRGYGTWGLEMQDDITDGARWLIDQGIADPDRIGVYGASYGGFTSLAALISAPEVFRAGASLAGVTDLLILLSDDAYYWGLVDDMERLIGDRWRDRAELKAISPARNAHRIRAPVLIAHGTEDPRVHVSHAHAMADALKKHGADVETLLYDGEVHGFLDERNRIDFYTRLASFFERHLAARAAPPPAAARATAP
jgi:dienelactone hydrolase